MSKARRKKQSNSEENEDLDYVPEDESSESDVDIESHSDEEEEVQQKELPKRSRQKIIIEDDPDSQEEEAPRRKRASTKRYTNEEMYVMVSLVLQHPSHEHSKQAFWSSMLLSFGNFLLEGRNPSGLCNRWKKIAKLNKDVASLEGYKKCLAERLASETVKHIDETIVGVAGPKPNAQVPLANSDKPVISYELSGKREKRTRAPRKKPCDKAEQPSKQRNKEVKDSAPPLGNLTKPGGLGSAGVSYMGIKATTAPWMQKLAPKKRDKIDFDLIASKEQVELSRLEGYKSLAIAASVSHGRDLAIVKDFTDNTFEVKSVKKLSEQEMDEAEGLKMDVEANLKNWEKLVATLSNAKPANRRGLEETIRKYQEGVTSLSSGNKGFAAGFYSSNPFSKLGKPS